MDVERSGPVKGSGRHPVFAYGSNMHLRDVARWMRERELGEPAVECVQPASLPEHRIAWTYRSPAREAGAANVVPAAGREVPGVVLWVDEPTFRALDRKEGYPARYHRGEAPMTLRDVEGSSVDAWVYRVTREWRRAEPEYPRADYLYLMVESVREHGLPAWHLEAVLRTPTVHPRVGVVVRPAATADAPAIAELCGEGARAEGSWVAERSGRILGVADRERLEVAPEARRRGVEEVLRERLGWLGDRR